MSPVEVYNPSTPSSASRLLLSASSESSDGDSAPVVPRPRCQRPGRRLIGGRIYDSILGVTCHWCRQKTVEDHVHCCQCTIAFCGGCLKNRHGELIDIEMKEDVNWVCPKCRGGCGHGCTHCCNCGPCRKAQGLEPTGLLVHTARACGFTNVHDYLIHKNTGESQENIAERKLGKGWCQTGQLSPTKKQKIEDDKVERVERTSDIEGGCRKRLSFNSCDSGQQVNNMSADDKLLLPDALQKNEVNQANMSADEKLLLLCPLQGEEDDHREPKSMAAPSSQKKVTPVHGSANQPNIFATAFSRSESDALWGRFSSDFKFPPENEEGSTSPSTSGKTHSNVSDARDLAGPSTSEIDSNNRSENPTPIFSGVKKEKIDEEQQKTHAVVAKLESMDSQEAQCNIGLLHSMNVEGHQDRMMGSLLGPTLSAMSLSHPKNSLLTATIKEEREDCQSKQWSPLVTKSTTGFSQMSTLWHSVKVKEEREDPWVANVSPIDSNNPKNQGSLASQVKKEVIVDTQMSKVICIDDDGVNVDCPVDGIQATSVIKKSGSLGAVPQVWSANDFKSRLEAKLSERFSMKELEILTEAVSHRKPIFKVCETRQGCSQFSSQQEEYSCLDHHPDLASQLESSSRPVYKLSLLRGFFFWLEHARTQGAFKPWTLVSQSSETPDNNDCVEIEGPDCEIVAVVPSVDEEVHGTNLSKIITV